MTALLLATTMPPVTGRFKVYLMYVASLLLAKLITSALEYL